MSRSHYFNIAEHTICINFRDGDSLNDMGLLPSFHAFATDEPTQPLLLTMDVDDSLRPMADKQLVRKFDTGNGDTVVHQLPDGGYQYIVRDIMDGDCCLMIADSHFSHCRCALNGDWTMRSFGLNNALMMAFAFAGAYHQTMLIHASVSMIPAPTPNNQATRLPDCQTTNLPIAFPFTAASGTGKSTHTSLWLKHIEGTQLLNDDNPAIRIIDGVPYIYGSPWSGKTPCYRNRKALLGAVTLIERAQQNSIEKLNPVTAFATLLPACSSMKWDEPTYGRLCDAIAKIIETTPVYTLHCLPDEGAARLSYQTLTAPWMK